MKKILMLIIAASLFVVSGCTENKFEISNKIHPTILDFGGNIAMEYKLGNILVLDELNDLNVAQTMYFVNNKDTIELQLIIKYEDSCPCFTEFEYYLGGNKIEVNRDVVEAKVLMENYDNISNFIWFIKDGKEILNQLPASTAINGKGKL
jgi:hypothetical protein